MKKEKTQKSRPAEPCVKNVKRSGASLEKAYEVRAAHICEKARDTVRNTDGQKLFEELPGLFPDLIASLACEPEPGSPLDREIAFSAAAVTCSDGMLAARFLRKEAGYPDIPAAYFNTDAEKPEGERIAYFKNPLADDAFARFSERMASPSVSYAQDLRSVCEAVYYEKAAYGILPLYSSRDGRLSGFYGLVDKYELFVVGQCSVYSSDNETATRFALLSKHPNNGASVKGKELFFEFRIPHDGKTLAMLLAASAYFELANVSVDSLPAETKNADVLIFKGKGEAVCDMLFYLYCLDIQYTLIGVYPE